MVGYQMGSCAKNYKNLPRSLFLGINGLRSYLGSTFSVQIKINFKVAHHCSGVAILHLVPICL